jgi:hypothetical protein
MVRLFRGHLASGQGNLGVLGSDDLGAKGLPKGGSLLCQWQQLWKLQIKYGILQMHITPALAIAVASWAELERKLFAQTEHALCHPVES